MKNDRPSETVRDLIALVSLSVIVGFGAGTVGALFQLALAKAEVFRESVVSASLGFVGLVVVVAGSATAASLAAWLVRRFSPEASGSGIPHVEAVLERKLEPAALWLLPIKFVGGVLAIGSGFALGREGPSVQMGASVANGVSRLFRRSWEDRRALIAAGAGAGLSTAFNAPGAGAIFVLEELIGKFEARIGIVALAASVSAIVVSRAILGSAPNFSVTGIVNGGVEMLPLFVLMGLLAGLLAVLYNRSLLGTLSLAERIGGPIELRAAVIGVVIGVLAWTVPDLVGGGDAITQKALNGQLLLVALPGIILLRLALGSISYAAATPGGLFAPMLVLGALSGLGFGLVAKQWFPGLDVQPAAFAMVGMGAFFAGVTRAPLTGIVLVIEMTDTAGMLLPLLASCSASMLVTEMLRDPPVYESLKQRSLTEPR